MISTARGDNSTASSRSIEVRIVDELLQMKMVPKFDKILKKKSFYNTS